MGFGPTHDIDPLDHDVASTDSSATDFNSITGAMNVIKREYTDDNDSPTGRITMEIFSRLLRNIFDILIISGQRSQFNSSSNLKDNSTVEVSSKAENKVEENLFAIDDKWVTNERNRRKCKRSSIEKMKLNGSGISEYGDKKNGMVKNNVGNFNSTLNLNLSSIMSFMLNLSSIY